MFLFLTDLEEQSTPEARGVNRKSSTGHAVNNSCLCVRVFATFAYS
jgi:hypothetical protein